MKDIEDIIKKQLIEEVETLQKQIDKQKKEELLRQSEGKLNAIQSLLIYLYNI